MYIEDYDVFFSWMTRPWLFCYCRCLQVPLPFSTFIGFCKRNSKNDGNSCSFNSTSEGHQLGESVTEQGCSPFVDDAPQQIYLAQIATQEFYGYWYLCWYFFCDCLFSFIYLLRSYRFSLGTAYPSFSFFFLSINVMVEFWYFWFRFQL